MSESNCFSKYPSIYATDGKSNAGSEGSGSGYGSCGGEFHCACSSTSSGVFLSIIGTLILASIGAISNFAFEIEMDGMVNRW